MPASHVKRQLDRNSSRPIAAASFPHAYHNKERSFEDWETKDARYLVEHPLSKAKDRPFDYGKRAANAKKVENAKKVDKQWPINPKE